MDMSIRPACLTDAGGVSAIYNYFVANTAASFEEQAVGSSGMATRMEAVIDADYPWFVAQSEGVVCGYAYASPWNARHAYRFTVEVTIYLHPDYAGQGLGARLYDTLFARLREQGFRTVIAVITLPNAPSVALHEKFGLAKSGHFSKVGFKFERWIDVGYWCGPLQTDN